jgi:transcriptional regulator with XRE-family HTH domain
MGVRDREAERQVSFIIARNIRHILTERGLTQADLARMTGMQDPTINRHLVVDDTPAGRQFQRCPTIPLLLRYCEALHVSTDAMLGRNPSKQWVDPDIQQFFEEDYTRLDPEARSWCRHTIDLMRRYAARMPSDMKEKRKG